MYHDLSVATLGLCVCAGEKERGGEREREREREGQREGARRAQRTVAVPHRACMFGGRGTGLE